MLPSGQSAKRTPQRIRTLWRITAVPNSGPEMGAPEQRVKTIGTQVQGEKTSRDKVLGVLFFLFLAFRSFLSQGFLALFLNKFVSQCHKYLWNMYL